MFPKWNKWAVPLYFLLYKNLLCFIKNGKSSPTKIKFSFHPYISKGLKLRDDFFLCLIYKTLHDESQYKETLFPLISLSSVASLAALASFLLLKSMVTDVETEGGLEAKRMADEEEEIGCSGHESLENQGDCLKGRGGGSFKPQKRRQSLYNFSHLLSLPFRFNERTLVLFFHSVTWSMRDSSKDITRQ